MSNAVMFKDYLTKVNIPMVENKDEAGSVFFRTKQDLRSGGTVLMVISFPPEDGFVDLVQAGTLAGSNLDAYYEATRLVRLSYPKPEAIPSQI